MQPVPTSGYCSCGTTLQSGVAFQENKGCSQGRLWWRELGPLCILVDSPGIVHFVILLQPKVTVASNGGVDAFAKLR